MTTESGEVATESAAVPSRSAWWVRALALVPWGVLYAFARFIAWLALRVFPYRKDLVHRNLSLAFPDLDERALMDVKRRYYIGFAEMFVELVKSARMTPADVRARVTLKSVELAREQLVAGRPVLMVAAHQCNWEWMLLALSLDLGHPLDAAYKPLVDPWAEREMFILRSRFGARLIPAKTMLADIIRRRDVARGIAMVADQEPTSSERRHWARFLNRDTAFYMGPEEIARVTKYPVLFVAMRRVAQGRYELEFEPLAAAGEKLAPGELTERYKDKVETQIRAAPPDWPWSHKRWRLAKPLYGKS